ncbi:MAG TPA: PAS domain S-box protein, partial [Cyanophyceae cyanobacterium]
LPHTYWVTNSTKPDSNYCPQAITDIDTASLPCDCVGRLAQWQINAQLLVPIHQKGQLWGWLILHQCSTPRQWQPSEIDGLTMFTAQLAIAMQHATKVEQLQAELTLAQQATVALQKANHQLANQVNEYAVELKRTHEQLQQEIAAHQQTERVLQQSHDQLQALLNAVPGCVSWISSDLRYLGVNSGLATLFNLSPENFVGQKIGFLKSHYEFAEFVRQFFANTNEKQQASVEISRDDNGSSKTYLIAAQKYHQNQSAVFVGIDVSNHRTAEEALLRSAATNRALLNAIPDLMFRINRDGTFVNYKAPKESDLFIPPSEFLGKKINEVMPKEAVPTALHCVEQALKTGELQVFEYQFSRHGSISHWEARFAVSDHDEVMAIVRNITERKQAEEELKEAKERLELVIRACNDGFWDWNFLTGDIYFSPRWKEMIGYSDDEFPNNLASWEKAIVEEDRIAALKLVEDYNTGRVSRFLATQRFRHKNGSIVYILSRAIHLKDGTGQVVRMVGAHTDITELVKAQDALQESEERFRQMAENIREVFWMTDLDKKQMVYVSPAYEEIWGRSCESLYQNPESFVDSIHPDDRTRVMAAFEKQIRGEYDEEYRVVQRSGQERWIRDRAFPIRNAQGQVYRIVGIAEDITEEKRVQQEMLNALHKEKELSELKSRFVSMTSHEFRTPLTTILGSAELLKHYSHNWTEEKKLLHFDRIHATVRHLTHMLDDMLLIGKTESGRLEFNPTPMDVVEFCHRLVEEFRVSDRNQHKIILINQGQSAIAGMDEKLLRHVLGNLLSNALKYSPIGTTVRFELMLRGGRAIFQIQDQGIGIPPEDQESLFEPFHRARNVGKISGTGLGLAIVKRTVDLQGGVITVSSEVGIGTTFRVSIPLH